MRAINLAQGEMQTETKGCVQIDQRAKFKFKNGYWPRHPAYRFHLCSDISKVHDIKVTYCSEDRIGLCLRWLLWHQLCMHKQWQLEILRSNFKADSESI